jgi:DNA-binding MarR family transcriptional regulator
VSGSYADRLMAYLAEHPGAGVPELASTTGVTNERARQILKGAERAGQAERFRRTPGARVWSWRRTGAAR